MHMKTFTQNPHPTQRQTTKTPTHPDLHADRVTNENLENVFSLHLHVHADVADLRSRK